MSDEPDPYAEDAEDDDAVATELPKPHEGPVPPDEGDAGHP